MSFWAARRASGARPRRRYVLIACTRIFGKIEKQDERAPQIPISFAPPGKISWAGDFVLSFSKFSLSHCLSGRVHTIDEVSADYQAESLVRHALPPSRRPLRPIGSTANSIASVIRRARIRPAKRSRRFPGFCWANSRRNTFRCACRGARSGERSFSDRQQRNVFALAATLALLIFLRLNISVGRSLAAAGMLPCHAAGFLLRLVFFRAARRGASCGHRRGTVRRRRKRSRVRGPSRRSRRATRRGNLGASDACAGCARIPDRSIRSRSQSAPSLQRLCSAPSSVLPAPPISGAISICSAIRSTSDILPWRKVAKRSTRFTRRFPPDCSAIFSRRGNRYSFLRRRCCWRSWAGAGFGGTAGAWRQWRGSRPSPICFSLPRTRSGRAAIAMGPLPGSGAGAWRFGAGACA